MQTSPPKDKAKPKDKPKAKDHRDKRGVSSRFTTPDKETL
jgi:hypothetical protein